MTQDPLQTLVVEDDEDQRVLLTRILEGRGHEVVAFGTSAEGLLAYQRNPCPLVILDIMLPDMNGVELCREMRLVPESAQTVILFATGVDGREGLEEALSAGADDYLTKPLTGDLLHVRLTIAERQVRALQRQKQRELDLMRDALRDPITDLPNRQLFSRGSIGRPGATRGRAGRSRSCMWISTAFVKSTRSTGAAGAIPSFGG